MAEAKEEYNTLSDQFSIDCIDSEIYVADLKRISTLITKGDVGEAMKQLEERRDSWKNGQVNIGVIGRSGVGKSTFINAYRNIEYDDAPGAAPVGVTQTTMEATSYPDPNHENIILWDVPGVGTSQFPRSGYLTNPKVGLTKYDFVIIITATRFEEEEIWLYDEMKKQNMPTFFVRTKVMHDVHNEHKRKRANKGKSESSLIQEVIREYNTEMNTNARIYYIDSHEKDQAGLDFGKLMLDMVKEAPTEKRETVLLNLETQFSEIIDEKIKTLKKRRWLTAYQSAAISLRKTVFCLRADLNIDQDLIEKQIMFYRQQLGLEKISFDKKDEDPAREEIKQTLLSKLTNPRWWVEKTSPSMIKRAIAHIPVFGQLGFVRDRYWHHVITLGTILDGMAGDLHKLKEVVLQEITE